MKIEKVYRKDLGQWRWKIDVTIAGRRIRRADFLTRKQAEEAIAFYRSKIIADRYSLPMPTQKVTLLNLKSSVTKDQSIKPRTAQIFSEFVELVGEQVSLTSLTKADWRKFVDLLKGRNCKPGTINRYMADVSTVLSSASESFPDLGDWSHPKAPWLPDSIGRNRLLSKSELSKILFALRSERQFHEQYFSVKNRHEVLDLFRLMLLTGAREGEILNLTPSQISWDWRTITIRSEKGGGSVRVVPLSDSALEILRLRSGQQLFSINKDRLYRTLRRVAEISGVAYGDNVFGGWVLYDLRHCAATVMENAGVPYSAVSAILGHKRTDQTATYAHAQLETLRKAVLALENYCREIDGFMSDLAQKTPLSAMLPKSVAR
jgi:integrase